MKILQVIPYFPPAWSFGGPPRCAFYISRELVRRGHDVTVYTTNALDQKRNLNSRNRKRILDGVKVYYFRNVIRIDKLFISPGMISVVKREIGDFDVVHLHEYRKFQNVIVNHYAKKYCVPYILQAHGSLPRIMAKRRLKSIVDGLFGYRLLRDASKVIALSQTEVDQYRGIGVPEEKIAVIPSGIDLSEYADLPSKGSFKKKFNINDDEKIVLYLGRIHKIKGIDILVKAFANVIEMLDDVRLVVVGPDDGYLGELEVLANDLKIKDNVLILGPLYGKDKLEAYVDAGVYVLPSRYEIWGMTVLEAYLCGKPVVASRVGGLKDLAVHGVTGLLVQPGDVRQLTYSIVSLLNDGERGRKMGLKGKQFVKDNFSIEKVVDRLENLYMSTNQQLEKKSH